MPAARVLVLGGTSYVAQFLLARHLSAPGIQWTAACTMRGREAALPPGFESADVTQPAPANRERVRVYWDVDLGTMTGVRESVRHFRPDVVVNCVGAMRTCFAANDGRSGADTGRGSAVVSCGPTELVEFLDHEVDWGVRLVHFSTDFVYDGASPPPLGYSEDDASADTSQLTVYGASKLRFDRYLLAKQSGVGGFVLRIANILGPRAPLFPERQSPKFMEWLHEQFFRPDAAAVRLWSDEIRSFVYVRDLVAILVALLDDASPPPRFTLLNIGGVDALSRVQLAERYADAHARLGSSGAAAAIAPAPRAAVDLGYHPPLDARLDTRRLRHALPEVPLTPTVQFLDEICRELAHKEALG